MNGGFQEPKRYTRQELEDAYERGKADSSHWVVQVILGIFTGVALYCIASALTGHLVWI